MPIMRFLPWQAQFNSDGTSNDARTSSRQIWSRNHALHRARPLRCITVSRIRARRRTTPTLMPSLTRRSMIRNENVQPLVSNRRAQDKLVIVSQRGLV